MRITANRLLNALEDDIRNAVADALRPMSFDCGAVIDNGGVDTPFLLFPDTLMVAHAEVLGDGARHALGLIGREGVVGWPLLLGDGCQGHYGVVQAGGGTGMAIDLEALHRLCSSHAALHRVVLHFIHSFTVQMGCTLTAGLRDSVERRVARWLVMLHDRIEGDTIAMTHHALAEAINVRRASVTDILHLLEGDRILRCTRAMIHVRDRARLQAIAGPAYGPAEEAYARGLGPFAKTVTSAPDTPRSQFGSAFASTFSTQ